MDDALLQCLKDGYTVSWGTDLVTGDIVVVMHKERVTVSSKIDFNAINEGNVPWVWILSGLKSEVNSQIEKEKNYENTVKKQEEGLSNYSGDDPISHSSVQRL